MFSKLIENNRVPHTLLLAGRNTQRLEEEARKLAAQLTSSPDLIEYYPEGKLSMHPIDKMRELKDEVYSAPYQHSKKVVILFEADRMLPQSANALLKTFEEPAPCSFLILTTTRKEKILPTILSRCQTFWVPGSPQVEPLLPEVEEFLKHGKYQDSRSYFAQIKKITAEYEKIEDTLELQEATEELFRQLDARHPQKVRFIEEARLKQSRSTSFQAILESLFIKLGYL